MRLCRDRDSRAKKRSLEDFDRRFELAAFAAQLADLAGGIGGEPGRLTGVDFGLANRLRSVSVFIPSRAEIAFIAAHSPS